jgi:cytochrome c553
VNFITLKKGIGAAIQLGIGTIALILLLASCSGSSNPGDVITGTPPGAIVAVSGPDSFLLYPNPQSNPAVNSQTYAQAYYAAIDPNNNKDTLVKWKAANGFGSGTGVEIQAVFGDVRDLGYGRYITARQNTDGTVAFFVDNYLVWSAAGYAYSSMNLDAAVARDQRWYIGTNAIEFTPGPNGGAPFAKYFTFDPVTGARLLAANLDGRGAKAMPGVCIGCHGGRGDPLTAPDTSGIQLFPLVGDPSSASGVRGDVKGKLHFLEPDTFSFSSLAGFTRPDQEANIKTLNTWILSTYPLASGVTSTYPEDQYRVQAPLNEWQGGAADVLKAAYGGDGLPNATYSDTYVPASWVAAGQSSLYLNVVQPTCRMCHILRGTGLGPDNSFSDFASFQGSADRIKAHIIDRGNMPLTRVLYNRFWSTPSMYNTLDQFLQSPSSGVGYTVLDNIGAPLLPGRPIADPGPNRVVGTSSTTLSAAMSLYADTFTWSIYSDPSGTASLSSISGAQTTLNTTVNGIYVVQLVASKSNVQSNPALLTVKVDNTVNSSNIHFSDIKVVLQRTTGMGASVTNYCINCHAPQASIAPAMANAGIMSPPIIYANIPRTPASVAASSVTATDDTWFYYEVLGRINFSDIVASPLLRKPSGYHHHDGVPAAGNGIIPGFGVPSSGVPADQLAPGDTNRTDYDLFLNWILNGAPY